MSPDAAAVFAQVIPVLLIATYLGSIGLHRSPRIIKHLLIYNVAFAGFVEFALLYQLATSTVISGSATTGALLSVAFLLLMLVFIATVRLGSGPQPDHDSGNYSKAE